MVLAYFILPFERGVHVRDTERISRLLGAVLNECSGTDMDSVKTHVLRAMNALHSAKNKKPEVQHATHTYKSTESLMTKEQGRQALDEIQSMIDEESEKMRRPSRVDPTILG